MNRSGQWLIPIFVLAFLLSFMAPPTFGQGEKETQDNGYLGAETCKDCHPEIFEAFKMFTPHWINYLNPKVSAERKGCEACHGPGQKHAEAEGKGFIFSFKDKSAKERSEACLKCHETQKRFFQFVRGTHKLSAVGCNDCHQIHGTPVGSALLKARELDLCFSCHGEVKSKFYLPTRHKVLEGAVKCTDCHTPHGTRTRASLRTWNAFNVDACFKCHPEKRGPFVFEHSGGKAEGCGICHTAHGSANRFLLIRKDVRTVCIECHGQVHFNRPRPGFSCVNCHAQIHGSNFSSRFFQ